MRLIRYENFKYLLSNQSLKKYIVRQRKNLIKFIQKETTNNTVKNYVGKMNYVWM